METEKLQQRMAWAGRGESCPGHSVSLGSPQMRATCRYPVTPPFWLLASGLAGLGGTWQVAGVCVVSGLLDVGTGVAGCLGCTRGFRRIRGTGDIRGVAGG